MALSLGAGFTLVVTEHGDLYAFGTNRNGQLGLGTTSNQLLPALVDKAHAFAGEAVASVCCGREHAACVTRGGDVFVWGCNKHGQLGLDMSAQPAAAFETAAAAAPTACAALAASGALPPPWSSCWRPRGSSAPTAPDSRNVVRPLAVPRAVLHRAPARMVACGRHFTLLLTARGGVWGAGQNECGQLGLNDTEPRHLFAQIDPACFAGGAVSLVAAGERHSLALSGTPGALSAWGRRACARLGPSTLLVPTAVPPESFGGSEPVFVDAGDDFSMVVTADGALYAGGMNIDCQLGLGNQECSADLKRVGGTGAFKDQRVRSVRCGSVHSVILTEDSELWSCGLATGPLCGTHDRPGERVKRPARIRHARFHGDGVAVFAAGVSHSAAVTSAGGLYTWGEGANYTRADQDSFSALGLNNFHVQWLPRKVCTASLGGARVGGWHTIRHDILLAFVMVTHKRLGDRSVFQSVLCEIIHVIIAPVCALNTPGGFQDLLGRLQ